MAKETAKTEATTAAPKKRERKVLTPAERIAKLEAELEAARKKAEAKSRKQIDEQLARRAKLIERVTDLDEKIEAINDELQRLGYDTQAEATSGTETGAV